MARSQEENISLSVERLQNECERVGGMIVGRLEMWGSGEMWVNWSEFTNKNVWGEYDLTEIAERYCPGGC